MVKTTLTSFNVTIKEGKAELPIVSLVNETGNYTKQVDDNRYGDTEFPLAGVEIHDAESACNQNLGAQQCIAS